MTKTSKSAAAAPAETEVPVAERIDMNDPALTDVEAVARNLGLTEAAPAEEQA